LKRKQFLKLSLLSAAGLYFTGCHNKEEVQVPEVIKQEPIPDNVSQPPSLSVKMYKKGEPKYEQLRKGFNKRIDKYPAVIAHCQTTEEVTEAVKYAVANKLPVAVKSGGHSFEGFSSNNNGMVVNVSSLNKITWEDEHTIIAGPGCTLAQLYAEILPKKKLLPAGSCAGVGLAGLALGGGYGLFSRKYGLTCDSLTEVTMVDGKGNIRNSKDDAELLWACRGGGNGNFGIVTALKFKLVEAPSYLQSTRFSIKGVDPERAKGVLEKWFGLTSSLPQSCFSAYVLNKKTLYILLSNCEEETAEVSRIIAELSSLVDKTRRGRPAPLATAVQVFYGLQQPTYFKNASAGLYESYSDIRDFIPKVLQKVTTTPGMIYQVNTLGGKIMDKDLEQVSAFPHRSKKYLSELQTYWQTGAATQKMVDSFEEVQQVFRSNGIKAQYRNYPDIELKDWETAYYGGNYKRLQKIKAKYDPDNNIRHEQSVIAG
jgi:hypothetical protein